MEKGLGDEDPYPGKLACGAFLAMAVINNGVIQSIDLMFPFLLPDLIQKNPGAHGYIEGFGVATPGNGDHLVAFPGDGLG